MKRESFTQYSIVMADSAQSLTEQLNAEIRRLRAKQPRVTFDGLIARIEYTETDEEPEDIRDEYKMKGVQLTCQDCPFFEPILKADGTEDRRVKIGDCPHKPLGRTFRDSKACDILFQKINNGEVRLCLAE